MIKESASYMSLLLVAATLRLVFLLNKSLTYTSLQFINPDGRWFSGRIYPIYSWILTMWCKHLSCSDLSLRLPAVIISLITIVLCFTWGSKWRSIGILLAIEPITMLMSQTGTVVPFIILMVLINTRSLLKGQIKIYFLSALLGLYASWLMLIFIPVQLIIFLSQPERFFREISTFGLWGFLVLPIITFVPHTYVDNTMVVATVSLSSLMIIVFFPGRLTTIRWFLWGFIILTGFIWVLNILPMSDYRTAINFFDNQKISDFDALIVTNQVESITTRYYEQSSLSIMPLPMVDNSNLDLQGLQSIIQTRSHIFILYDDKIDNQTIRSWMGSHTYPVGIVWQQKNLQLVQYAYTNTPLIIVDLTDIDTSLLPALQMVKTSDILPNDLLVELAWDNIPNISTLSVHLSLVTVDDEILVASNSQSITNIHDTTSPYITRHALFFADPLPSGQYELRLSVHWSSDDVADSPTIAIARYTIK